MIMKKLKLTVFVLLVIFALPGMALGAEHFLFDAEENKILFMDDDDLSFTPRLDMEKIPDLLMKTADPDKYLAIYGPERSAGADKDLNIFDALFKSASDDQKSSIAGQLILFNVKTGRTEDLVDVGFAPFNWEYTEDRRDFFITYRVSDTKDSGFELLHYNILEMTCDSLELPADTVNINQIAINQELHQLYLLLDNKDRTNTRKAKAEVSETPQILTINIEDLQVAASIPLESAPLNMRLLGKDKGVLICYDWQQKTYYTNGRVQRYIDPGKGTLTYLDLSTQKALEKHEVADGDIYYQWFPEEKIYISHFQTEESRFKTKYHFLKITKDGVEKTELPEEPLDFGYYPEEDKLYILQRDTLCTIDYKTKRTATYQTGDNTYKQSGYSFRKIPQSDLAVIYSVRDGKVKFYDLKTNRVERKTLSGRTWGKVGYLFKTILTRPTEAATMISANADQSRLYVYNRMSNDITVYDRNFQPVEYIVTPEPALGIHQITEPTMKTLVFTGKKIYELADQELNLLHIFDRKTDQIFVAGEKNRVIILSGTELLVLDPETLQTENRIQFFVGRHEKYTKLKAGDQRFYFIETL